MLTLFKNALIYSPDFIGKKDLLVGGNCILAIQDEIEIPRDLEVQVFDCEGLKIVPGLIALMGGSPSTDVKGVAIMEPSN